MAAHSKRGPAPVVGVMQQKIFGLPVDRDIIFSNHKALYKKKVEKRQRGLIIRLPFLKPFLKHDEKILLVTTGHSPPTIFEKMGLGWLFVYLKRSLLVFTDRRLFHVPTTPVYKYRHSLAHIPYGNCQSMTLRGRSLVIAYPSSPDTDKFFSIAGKEKKKLRVLLRRLPIGEGGDKSAGRIHLCPQCTAPLSRSHTACQHCQLEFKSGIVATLLAVFLPGSGYFYVRQAFLGVMAAILEVMLMVAIGGSLNDLINGVTAGIPLFVGASILFVIAKLAAVVHAQVFIREFVPRLKVVTFQGFQAQTA